MKTHTRLLTLAAIAALTTFSLADSPDAILKDYRKAATGATERLNQTLETQSAKIATDLMRKGDAAGAKNVQSQIHQVLSGYPTTSIPAPLDALLKQYLAARAATIAPMQKASLARIDALLKMAGGQKIETVTELAKVRQEIEGGNITDARKIPVFWTYHQTPTGKADAEITLNTDGTYEYKNARETVNGTWKIVKNTGIILNFKTDVWKVAIEGDLGTIQQDVGTRYMRAVTGTPPGQIAGGR